MYEDWRVKFVLNEKKLAALQVRDKIFDKSTRVVTNQLFTLRTVIAQQKQAKNRRKALISFFLSNSCLASWIRNTTKIATFLTKWQVLNWLFTQSSSEGSIDHQVVNKLFMQSNNWFKFSRLTFIEFSPLTLLKYLKKVFNSSSFQNCVAICFN